MQKDPISVHVDTPLDEVAQIIEKYDLVAIPVLDSIGRLVGQITVDDVMDEVREQSEPRLSIGFRSFARCRNRR